MWQKGALGGATWARLWRGRAASGRAGTWLLALGCREMAAAQEAPGPQSPCLRNVRAFFLPVRASGLGPVRLGHQSRK